MYRKSSLQLQRFKSNVLENWKQRDPQAFSIQINTTTTYILLHSFSLERSLPPFSLHSLGFTGIDKFPNIYFRKSIVAYKYFLSNSYNVKALLSAFIKEVYNYFRFIQTRKRFKIVRLEFTKHFCFIQKRKRFKIIRLDFFETWNLQACNNHFPNID